MRVVIQSLLCLAMTITLIGCGNNKVIAPDKDKLKALDTQGAAPAAPNVIQIQKP